MSKKRRQELKRLYGELFEQISAVLFAADPIGIKFESNTDEYDPEAGTIIPRLRECCSAEDARRVVYEEFVGWFGADIAGPEQTYEQPAREIWQLWQRTVGGKA